MNELSVGVPFSGCEKYYREKNIIATREDEAIAIASGAYLCGQKPLVYMQNSGLGNCIDIITSLLKPYKITLDILVQIRHTPEHHRFMGTITGEVIRLLNYDSFRSC